MTNEQEIHLSYRVVPGKSRPISGVGEKKVSTLSKSLFYHSSGNILGQACHLFLYGLWANNDFYMFKWLKTHFLKIISWYVKIIGNKMSELTIKYWNIAIYSFYIVYEWAHATTTELSSCNRVWPKLGLSRWYSGKESTCKCWRCWSRGSSPASGRSPGVGNGNPLQFSCWENQWTNELGGL